MLRAMIAADILPDYQLEELPGDMLRVSPRVVLTEDPGPPLRADTLEEARALLPGADIYAIEAEWRAYWVRSGRPRLRAPDRAFLGFVASWHAREA